MRTWTLVAGGCIAFLTNLSHTYGQSPTPSLEKYKHEMMLTDVLADSPRSKRSLDSIMLRHRAPLILIKSTDSVFVFVPHNACYDKRHFKGSYEERNKGGDAEKRGTGGDSDTKQAGGVTAERAEGGSRSDRDTGGDMAGRETGGNAADRKQAGNRAKRAEGGDDAGRAMKGDDSERSLAGKNKQRTEAGETSDRDMKGEQTNRFTEGANRKRRWSGAFKLFKKKQEETDDSVYCQKSIDQPTFQLSNVPEEMTVEVYDVMSRRKVERLLVEYF